MSEELIAMYMDQMNVSTKSEVALCFEESFQTRKEDTIAYYGDDWRAEVIEVEIKAVDDGFATVLVSISHEGSDALWHTNIDEWWIYLVEEDDGWRVYDFEG